MSILTSGMLYLFWSDIQAAETRPLMSQIEPAVALEIWRSRRARCPCCVHRRADVRDRMYIEPLCTAEIINC